MEYIQRVNDGFLVRSFYVCRMIPKEYDIKFEEILEETFRTFISFSGKHYKFYYYQSYFGTSEWRYVNAQKSYNGTPYCPGGTLYTKNLSRVFKDTEYQYCQLAEFARHMSTVHSPTYLERYLNVPCIEYLVKLKMYRLMTEVCDKHNHCLSDPHGKNPAEVFGVPKSDVKALIKLNISGTELEIWRWCRDEGKPISEEDIQIIQSCDMNVKSFEFIKRLSDITPLTKYLRYLKKQIIGTKTSMSNVGLDWLDYVGNCQKLNYNLNDETILFPRDLKKAHDRAYQLIEVSKNKASDDKIRAMYLKKMKQYSYREEDYFITVASCVEDLIQEGQKMHHCVGTYIDRVAKNQCTILFIRSIAEPNKPLATCEVRDNEPIQIRAQNDEVPPKEVLKFWERFKAQKLKKQPQKMKAENRKAG
jgi:hypothetical protein